MKVISETLPESDVAQALSDLLRADETVTVSPVLCCDDEAETSEFDIVSAQGTFRVSVRKLVTPAS